MSEIVLPRHVVVTGHRSTFRYERCVHAGCHVAPNGTGSRCGEEACPSCGSGGANLAEGDGRHRGATTCSICGHAWLPDLRATG